MSETSITQFEVDPGALRGLVSAQLSPQAAKLLRLEAASDLGGRVSEEYTMLLGLSVPTEHLIA